MKIRTRRKLMASLESVAMTDIILNMFIFFFISFSLLYTFNPRKQTQIPVSLPRSESAEPDKDQALEITVKSDGSIYVAGQSVSLERLKGEVAARIGDASQKVVLLRADEGADYGRVVRVLDQARQAGAQRLGLAAQSVK